MIQGWRVNICWGKTVKVYCWPCQLKLNCFRWFLWAGTKKRAFAKSIAAYHVPGDVLICSSKDTTSSIAAAIGTYWVFSSQLSFSTICLLHWTDRELKGDVIGTMTPTSFEFLMMALTSAVPPGIQYCFWFTIFYGRVNPRGFYLAFSMIIVPTPQVREPI